MHRAPHKKIITVDDVRGDVIPLHAGGGAPGQPGQSGKPTQPGKPTPPAQPGKPTEVRLPGAPK